MKEEIIDYDKQPFIVNIEETTLQNDYYRRVIWTGEKLQLAVMSIPPGEGAILEVHEGIDQFIRIEDGQGICKIGVTKDNLDYERALYDNDSLFIPADMWHNIINTGSGPLKFYTIYAGPEHPEGTVHATRQQAAEKQKP